MCISIMKNSPIYIINLLQEGSADKIANLESQIDEIEEELRKEKSQHENTREEVEELSSQVTWARFVWLFNSSLFRSYIGAID